MTTKTFRHSQPPQEMITETPEDFEREVLKGLAAMLCEIPSRFLYDARGSELSEEICDLPEYLVTRTELAIFGRGLASIARRLGPDCLVFEPGAGAGVKTRQLLAELKRPAGYVPVEISQAALDAAVTKIEGEFPDFPVRPVCGDFARIGSLPDVPHGGATVVFFPGSTIGNFKPPEAIRLLSDFARLAGADGALLIGVDLRKPAEELIRAYDDPAGVTAAFNRNLLRRVNRELEADFDLAAFAHRAVWDPLASRIEMHLVSRVAQRVTVRGRVFSFEEGDSIRTECSRKYTLESFADLTAAAGFETELTLTDDGVRFAVQLLRNAA